MHLLCPHCHSPIELVNLPAGQEIACPSCGSSFSLQAESTTSMGRGAGQRLGRFELIQVVGHGAFGTVYKARDPELDRVVALKVPHAGSLAAGKELTRFQREARAAAQLRHPHIVPVHEVGLADGVPFLVSDFVQGVTLTDLLSAGRLGFREAAELLATVADALHYAHEQGVIHRDVKPSNIMVGEDGRPFVMDFGLAKRVAGEVTMTVEGQVLGTPAFMPPEQARGEGHAVDARGDVYSLGVILYELLTGELPFRGTAKMLVRAAQTEEPRPPRKLNDHVPRDLETITLKAMTKEPAGRYATAGDLAADLRRWLEGEPIRARPISPVRRGARWLRRHPAVAGLLAASALALAAGVGLLVRSRYAGELERALDDANAQRARAEAAERRSRYRLGLSLALQAFEAGQGGVAVEQLSAVRPEAEGAPDQRGFEWHHLWRECHRHRAELPGHRDTVRAVAFHPDGRSLATAGLDGAVRLWDRATLALRWQRPSPAGHPVQALAFRADGSLLAAGGGSDAKGSILLCDAATGEPRGECSGHARQVTALTFAGGGQLISGAMDGTLRFWDVAARRELASFTLDFNDHPRALALSPDGKTLAVAGVNTILRLWNVADRKEKVMRRGVHRGPIWSVAFSPDGKYLATGSYDTRIGFWNPATAELMGFVPGHGGPVNGVAFLPNMTARV